MSPRDFKRKRAVVDLYFLALIAVLYAITCALIWAVGRLGDHE